MTQTVCPAFRRAYRRTVENENSQNTKRDGRTTDVYGSYWHFPLRHVYMILRDKPSGRTQTISIFVFFYRLVIWLDAVEKLYGTPRADVYILVCPLEFRPTNIFIRDASEKFDKNVILSVYRTVSEIPEQ